MGIPTKATTMETYSTTKVAQTSQITITPLIPATPVNTIEVSKFISVPKRWSKCSVQCGHGIKTARMACKNRKTGKKVNRKRNCPGSPKHLTEKCYTKCRWVSSSWSSCSGKCGEQKKRKLSCINVDDVKKDQTIHDGEEAVAGCIIGIDDKVEVMDCNKNKCTYNWRTGAWSKCSKSCGTSGTQRRQTSCGHPRQNISSELCTSPAPEKQRKCNDFPCEVESIEACISGNGVICNSDEPLEIMCRPNSLADTCCDKCLLYRSQLSSKSKTQNESNPVLGRVGIEFEGRSGTGKHKNSLSRRRKKSKKPKRYH